MNLAKINEVYAQLSEIWNQLDDEGCMQPEFLNESNEELRALEEKVHESRVKHMDSITDYMNALRETANLIRKSKKIKI